MFSHSVTYYKKGDASMALLDIQVGGQVKLMELQNCAQSCAPWGNTVLMHVAAAGMIPGKKMHYQEMVLYILLRHMSLLVALKSRGSPHHHL